MTDDIVTRLRDFSWNSSDDMPAEYVSQAIDEAADEIERLRREIDNVRAEVQRLSQIANY
jgi:archaellum component FlaC